MDGIFERKKREKEEKRREGKGRERERAKKLVRPSHTFLIPFLHLRFD